MTHVLVAVKVAAIVFAAAVLQATVLGAVDIGGGRPDLLFVAVLAIALARGTTVGAVAGFVGGLLFDLATFGTLGVTSLLLTLGGYWIGRYGETTGRGRAHAPVLSVLVMTIAYGIAAYVLHTILGDAVSARIALVDALLPALIGNLLLVVPVHALVARILAGSERLDRMPEVRLLG